MIWVLFVLFILVCLFLDLGVFNKNAHEIKPKEAVLWTSVWVTLAFAFSGVIWQLFSYQSAVNPLNITPHEAFVTYIAGYLIELSLSIDNIFVIAIIFSSFKIPAIYKHRVLFWGILGAVVFRALMIVFGIALITKFHWMFYVFGIFLLYTAISMLKSDEKFDPKSTWVYRKMSKFFPITHELDGNKFLTKINGKRYATPLLVTLVIIEITDILFALDSIPAILSITQNDFIVFSSNIMAILGLRSLFFLVIGMLEKFRYINYSLMIILAFVGVKMLFVDYFHVDTLISLLIIGIALIGGILASLYLSFEKD
jgi:tellurite resistance protein TerC